MVRDQHREDNEDSNTIAQLTESVIRQSRQIEQLKATREEQGNSSSNTTHDHGGERFHRLRPPTFNGRVSDHIHAEKWIRKIEDMFMYAKVEEGDKVTYAVFHLELDARHLWYSIRSTTNVGTMSWEMFKTAFFDKYFSLAVRASKKMEFMQLRQTGSVTDYICKFEALSGFAPHLVEDEEDKIHQFIQGLKSNLFKGVKTAWIHNIPYSEVAAKALELEDVEIIVQGQCELPRKFIREAQPPPRQVKGWKPQQNRGPQQQQKGVKRPFNPNDNQGKGKRPQAPLCSTYLKNHYGECKLYTGRCYRCDEVGHVVKDCPMPPDTNRARVAPRVFAMMEDDDAE